MAEDSSNSSLHVQVQVLYKCRWRRMEVHPSPSEGQQWKEKRVGLFGEGPPPSHNL